MSFSKYWKVINNSHEVVNFILKLNFHKLINMLKVEGSYILSTFIHRSIVWGMPYSYSIETTNICNLSCPECPTGKGITHRQKTEMSTELYQSLIHQIAPTATYLMLYLQGEPFLSTRIFEMINLADKHKIYTCISTNGNFLDRQNARKAIHSGLDRIIISLDGTTNDTYQQYRRGGDLSTVLEGIKNLVEEKKTLKSHTPFIILQFIVFKHNEHQIDEFKKLGISLGVNKVEIKTAQLYDFENGNPMITSLKKYSRYKKVGEKYVLKKALKNSCRRIWTTGVITTDGIVIPCCYDKLITYPMGNAEKSDLKVIWKNKEFKLYRHNILTCRKEIDICCNCNE
jgi:MoaA/NifB/PqqE/SkfB family radical SAM enzyme